MFLLIHVTWGQIATDFKISLSSWLFQHWQYRRWFTSVKSYPHTHTQKKTDHHFGSSFRHDHRGNFANQLFGTPPLLWIIYKINTCIFNILQMSNLEHWQESNHGISGIEIKSPVIKWFLSLWFYSSTHKNKNTKNHPHVQIWHIALLFYGFDNNSNIKTEAIFHSQMQNTRDSLKNKKQNKSC